MAKKDLRVKQRKPRKRKWSKARNARAEERLRIMRETTNRG